MGEYQFLYLSVQRNAAVHLVLQDEPAVTFEICRFHLDVRFIQSHIILPRQKLPHLAEARLVVNSADPIGFLIGAVGGVIAGVILGRNRLLADIFSIYIKIANSVPRVVLGSVFIIALGLGMASKVALAVVMVFFVVFANAFQGVREADRAMIANAQILGASPLHPVATATTVRVRDGRRLVSDGPYAETREQLGGYYLIDAADLDDALAIAARMPGARKGCVEVRPVMELPNLPVN